MCTERMNRRGGGKEIDRREVRAREEMGQAIAGRFPADREELVERAREAAATDRVVNELRQLPANEPFENVEAVWETLAGHSERRF